MNVTQPRPLVARALAKPCPKSEERPHEVRNFAAFFLSLVTAGCGSLAKVQVSDAAVSSNNGSGGDGSQGSGSGGTGDFGGSNSAAGSAVGSGELDVSTTGGGGTADPTGGAGSAMVTTDAGSSKPDAGGPVIDSGGGTPGKLTPAQTNLDGQKYLLACGPDQGYSNLVCQNPQGACPNQGQPYLTLGMHNRDEHVKFGGTAGTVYQVTIRVRGIVEPKHYTGGTKDTAHEGFYTGGAPSQSGNYNVYLLKISGMQGQSYYLERAQPARGSLQLRHRLHRDDPHRGRRGHVVLVG